MTPIPPEFTRDHIASRSGKSRPGALYTDFVNCGEPFTTTMRKNYHPGAKEGFGVTLEDARKYANTPSPGLNLEDDDLFYNTASGIVEEYWRDVDLPKPTKDIDKLREDLKKWGYCLVEDGLSPAQLELHRTRVMEQADGERLAGVACYNGSPIPPGANVPNTQLVHCLVNKGPLFPKILEFDPEACQAGPLIEQLITETIGSDFLCSSFIAIIAGKNNLPQNMHQDQACQPHQSLDGPLSCNTMWLLDDFRKENGGTLIVPGSHLLLSKGTKLEEPLPPAINLEAPAGTVVVFEGRVLHGTGVNRTNKRRAMMVSNSLKPFLRQQEWVSLAARLSIPPLIRLANFFSCPEFTSSPRIRTSFVLLLQNFFTV